MTEPKIIRSRRKTLSLTVNTNGEIIVKAPIKASKKLISEFLAKNESWIKNRQEKMHIVNLHKSQFSLADGLYYLGNRYPVTISNKCSFNGVFFTVKSFDFTSEKNDIIKVYKKLAKEYLSNRIYEISQRINIPFNSLKVSSARTRWGSCSSRRNINLCYRLMLLPEQLIDYVIVHELCHINNMNHSQNFWHDVEKALPDYKTLEKQLKEKGECIYLLVLL